MTRLVLWVVILFLGVPFLGMFLLTPAGMNFVGWFFPLCVAGLVFWFMFTLASEKVGR